MPFQFDPAKARQNLHKHGVSFADAEAVFEDPLALSMPDAGSEGEPRTVAIGLGGAGELLVVVYVERNGGIRLISARRPTRKEREAYES